MSLDARRKLWQFRCDMSAVDEALSDDALWERDEARYRRDALACRLPLRDLQRVYGHRMPTQAVASCAAGDHGNPAIANQTGALKGCKPRPSVRRLASVCR
jgi:hypothetical protein